MLKSSYKLLIPGCILIMTVCSLDPIVENPELLGDYYVFCTLSTEYQRQQVMVGRSVPEKLPMDIANARVSIKTENRWVSFSYVGKGYYRDINDSLKIEPGATYHLRVECPDGKVITGETTTPDAFEILTPAEGDTVDHYISQSLDTLLLSRVAWSKSDDSRFYSIGLREINGYHFQCHSVTTFRTNVFMPELLPASMKQFDDPVTGEKIVEVQLMIRAHDSATKFILQQRIFMDPYCDFTPEEQEIARLEYEAQTLQNQTNVCGGLGVFNGVTIVQRKIYLRLHFNWP